MELSEKIMLTAVIWFWIGFALVKIGLTDRYGELEKTAVVGVTIVIASVIVFVAAALACIWG